MGFDQRAGTIFLWDGAVLLGLQALCLVPLLPLREKSFPLACIAGAFLWGFVTSRYRPEVLRADRVVYGQRVWGRAPVRLLRAPLYGSALACLPYAYYVLQTGFDWTRGWLHPVALKDASWFIFGAGLLGCVALGLHFALGVVGVRAAFLAFGILPPDAGTTLDD